VTPPWYRSTLAYLVYIALFIGIITLITNYLRERRLEKLHAYKLQLFTDISHEIRSPLTLVLSPIDKLIKMRPMYMLEKPSRICGGMHIVSLTSSISYLTSVSWKVVSFN